MQRWELKMICAAVALFVSVVCSFLPFLLIYVNCKKLKQKFSRKIQKTETENVTGNNQSSNESPTNEGDTQTDVNDNVMSSSSHDNSIQNGESSMQDMEFLGYLMCFGGGVFLGTFLLHMLPEVTEILEDSLLIPRHIEYPLTELIIGIGFFMVLIVEELVRICQKLKLKKSVKQKFSPTEYTIENQNADVPIKKRKSSSDIALENVSIDTGIETSTDLENQRSDDRIATNYVDDDDDHHHHHHHDFQDHDHDHHHHHHHNHYSTRSIVLVLALSLHHIFEGLSIGLQKHYANVWHLTLAVLCHETAICFSMGLQFYKDNQKLNVKSFFIIITAASIMPLGIVIGIPISEVNQNQAIDDHGWQNILNGVLQALACGTFIYVTFFEILCDELTNGHSSTLKIFFVILGFTLMALLGLIPETAGDPDYTTDITTVNPNFTTISYLTTTNY